MRPLWEYLFDRDEEDSPVRTVLAELPLFEGLDENELEEIERILHRREYAPDEVVFHQGNPGQGMYVVLEGSVRIVREETGQELAQLGPGQFFGEVTLLVDEPRSATARAREASVAYGLFQPDLLELIDRRPELGVRVLKNLGTVLARRLIHTNEELERASEHPTDQPGAGN